MPNIAKRIFDESDSDFKTWYNDIYNQYTADFEDTLDISTQLSTPTPPFNSAYNGPTELLKYTSAITNIFQISENNLYLKRINVIKSKSSPFGLSPSAKKLEGFTPQWNKPPNGTA